MVIDSHEHIMFPVKMQLDKMDAAGVDKTVLFCTAPHPENAGTLKELEEEMAALNKILAGANSKEDNIRRLKKNISEVVEAVRECQKITFELWYNMIYSFYRSEKRSVIP